MIARNRSETVNDLLLRALGFGEDGRFPVVRLGLGGLCGEASPRSI